MRYLGLLLLSSLLLADTVHLKNGKRIEGRIVSEGAEIVINEYNSPLPQATFGQQRIPADKVKKVVHSLPTPPQEFQLRLRAADSAEACLALAQWADGEKLKEERVVALEKALRLDPANAAARAALGSRAPKGDFAAQRDLARRFLEEDDKDAVLAETRKEPSFPWSERELWRALRSLHQAKGYQRDRPVAMRADELLPNARYTLFVPDAYDPLVPTPLVIGLHGGGAGGADGKLVVGSGDQAIAFYQGDCDKRGWICACPTALRAGWQARENDDLIDALLDELRALYNIDENRIYLVGHSMGGGGTWAQGARLPETWAAIAPAASFGVQGIDQFRKTRTGFYVYHSDNDPRCSVDGVRPQMLSLPGTDADFVYTEIPNQEHGFPREVVEDIFAFFDARLLAVGPSRFKTQVRPVSSFERRESRDEKKYLPALAEGESEGSGDLGRLLRELRTGGGVSDQAAQKLIALADPKTSAAVAKVLLRPNTPPDIRRYAARVLGGRKAKDQLDALGRVLLIETEAEMLRDALEAIEAIGDPSAGDALLKFLRKRRDYFDQRRQGSQMDHSDFVTILPSITAACSLLGTYQTPKAAASIAENAVEAILLSPTRIVYDMKNQDPLPAARALAAAACGALGRLGDAAVRTALQHMVEAAGAGTGTTVRNLSSQVGEMGGWAGDPQIAGHAREALQAVGNG